MPGSKSISILGAGLVGSLLAIYLAKRGHKVDVYERRPDMRAEKIIAGRSINLALSDRGWKGLRGVGLESEIRKIAIPMYARMVHAVDGTLSRQAYGMEDQAIYSVSRGELNKSLMNLAEAQAGVQIHFNQFADHVNLKSGEIIFSNQSDIRETKSEIIFGADGAFSALRHSMQFLDRYSFSQTYIEHGYKELNIPGGKNGEWLMEKNCLHIWPRKSFMLIALPNLDGSFTCTLFFPFEGEPSFSSLKNENHVGNFFKEYFPDVIEWMPSYKNDFISNPTSSLVYVKCFPWAFQDRACLIGDAAHAVVPFFGQGMNCGFEDCTVLNELMNEHADDWKKIFSAFEQLRKPNADAISDLALNNFVEMRDLVADTHFLRKKKVEKALTEKYPDQITGAYSMVTFSHLPYSEALKRGKNLNQLIEHLMTIPGDDHDLDLPQKQKVIHDFLSS